MATNFRPVHPSETALLVLHWLRRAGFAHAADALEEEARELISLVEVPAAIGGRLKSLHSMLNEYVQLLAEKQARRAHFPTSLRHTPPAEITLTIAAIVNIAEPHWMRLVGYFVGKDLSVFARTVGEVAKGVTFSA